MKILRQGVTINNRGCKPDLGLTCEMYGFYRDGRTLAQVAKMFGVRRQGVWDRFKRRGLPMRPDSKQKALQAIAFNGTRYAAGKDNYFRKTGGDRSLLHWDVWEKAHGPMPRRHEVRFVDGDRMNVELANLLCVRQGAGRALARPFPALKPCLACGRHMLPRLRAKNPEGPAAYNKRRTCDSTCSASWKRGKPKGTRMPK